MPLGLYSFGQPLQLGVNPTSAVALHQVRQRPEVAQLEAMLLSQGAGQQITPDELEARIEGPMRANPATVPGARDAFVKNLNARGLADIEAARQSSEFDEQARQLGLQRDRSAGTLGVQPAAPPEGAIGRGSKSEFFAQRAAAADAPGYEKTQHSVTVTPSPGGPVTADQRAAALNAPRDEDGGLVIRYDNSNLPPREGLEPTEAGQARIDESQARERHAMGSVDAEGNYQPGLVQQRAMNRGDARAARMGRRPLSVSPEMLMLMQQQQSQMQQTADSDRGKALAYALSGANGDPQAIERINNIFNGDQSANPVAGGPGAPPSPTQFNEATGEQGKVPLIEYLRLLHPADVAEDPDKYLGLIQQQYGDLALQQLLTRGGNFGLGSLNRPLWMDEQDANLDNVLIALGKKPFGSILPFTQEFDDAGNVVRHYPQFAGSYDEFRKRQVAR